MLSAAPYCDVVGIVGVSVVVFRDWGSCCSRRMLSVAGVIDEAFILGGVGGVGLWLAGLVGLGIALVTLPYRQYDRIDLGEPLLSLSYELSQLLK